MSPLVHGPCWPARPGIDGRWLLDVQGYGQVGLALDTCSRLLPELQREVADCMDDVLGRLQPPQVDDRVADEVEDAGDDGPEAEPEPRAGDPLATAPQPQKEAAADPDQPPGRPGDRLDHRHRPQRV